MPFFYPKSGTAIDASGSSRYFDELEAIGGAFVESKSVDNPNDVLNWRESNKTLATPRNNHFLTRRCLPE